MAADLAPPPSAPAALTSPIPLAYNWSGFYFGAHGGWGFGGGGLDDGFVIGGQAGVNWQWNQFVLGVEGDGSFADMSGTNSLESIRGRAGFAFDKFLVYGTGGAAFEDFGDLGWVAGGGVQYAFTDNFSAGVEYLHYDFDNDSADVIRGRVDWRFNTPFGG